MNFLILAKFSNHNCPIANRKLAALAGQEPIEGGAMHKSEGMCFPFPNYPMLAMALVIVLKII